MMDLCVDCLKCKNPSWTEPYRKGSAGLMAYGAGVFLLPDSPAIFALQGIFFLVAFPWIVWPLFAAAGPNKPS